jgi:hypothetical protein
MATPALTGLPTELLDNIIPHVLPEGFESLALTCKRTHQLCIPFIERHARLRSQYERFVHRMWSTDPSLPPVKSAYDLLARIAVDPIIARYIKTADFSHDTYPPSPSHCRAIPHVRHGGPVVALFANSTHLKQAGLDWREYYGCMQEELGRSYSQYAAVFVLTLLPNVTTLRLPAAWGRMDDRTQKLVDSIVREARRSHVATNRPSLSQIARFELARIQGFRPKQLGELVPFLALPHVRSLHGPEAGGDHRLMLTPREPCLPWGEMLESAHLLGCCFDEVAISNFLRHTPRLRTLVYSHTTAISSDNQDWDVCKFVTAIEREAWGHLEELSINIRKLKGSITPGKTSLGGFQRLRKLELPLEIAMCNIADAESRATTSDKSITAQDLNTPVPFIANIVPASVSRLSLRSNGTKYHEKALRAMFFDFVARRAISLPVLEELHLFCPDDPKADNAYRLMCIKLLIEADQTGVVVHLHKSLAWLTALTWDGE